MSALPSAAPPPGDSRANEPPGPRWLHVVAVLLLVAFCAAVATITFWPGPPSPDGQRALRLFLRGAHLHGLPMWISFGRVEFAANIVMFLPIGFFGALALPRASGLVIPAALAASVAIELVQASRMPERVGTPRDVVANTIGAVVGYLLALMVLRVLRRRDLRRAQSVPLDSTGRPESANLNAAI